MQTENAPNSRATDTPGAVDFLGAWQTFLTGRSNLRLDAEADRAFWDGYASHYDERVAQAGSYAKTLALVQALVRASDTLLDVGAGTGRFAIPLARSVRQLTALDHAPAMLAILREKAATAGIDNLTVIEAALEDTAVPPHDVVLAAWSLYRQLDLRAALERLVTATRRTLIIVAPDVPTPPHRALVKAIWGGDGEPDMPTYLYILGGLRQIGIAADLKMVQETRRLTHPSPTALARDLAPVGASAADVARFAAALTPLLSQDITSFHYRYSVPAGVITWQRAP